MLSWKHVADMVNLCLLIAPLFPLLAFFAAQSDCKTLVEPKALFLAAFSLGGLIFLFIIDPKLGLGRDWDLFALTGLGPVLLMARMGEKTISEYRRYFPHIILTTFIAVAPFLATNLTRQSSIAYMSWLLRQDHEVSRSGMATLRDYYFHQGDTHHADSLDQAIRSAYPEYAFRDSIFALAGKGNPQLALSLADSLVDADPYNSENYNIRGSIYHAIGDYKKAIMDFEKVKTLNRYDYVVQTNLALSYQKAGDLTSMFKNLREAQERAPDYPQMILALSQGFMMRKQYDSAFVYGRRAIEVDKDNPMGYLSAGSAAYYLANRKWARACLTKYLEMVPQSSVRAQVEDMLSKIPE